MGYKRIKDKILLNILRGFLFLFAGIVGYHIFEMLRNGESSICKVAPYEYCKYVVSENPPFYWMAIAVWFIIFALLTYAFIQSIKAK